jgi:hypothetical protein
MQLFSGTLRATKQSADYTKALIYARGLMEEAYATGRIMDIEKTTDMEDGYSGNVTLTSLESTDGTTHYEITVIVRWPPSGSVELRGRRTISDDEKEEE